MEHIDFHISYNCLNRCLFCSSSSSIEKFNRYPLKIETILSLLRRKRGKGFTSVNFTGGEPTLFPGFTQLVKGTKKMGYRISVGTNGGRFKSKKFCLQIAPFLDEVYFSCHGHTSGLHNFLTANAASFAMLNRAMDNLSKFPIRFCTNTVVTKYNIDYLEETLNFIIKKKIKHVLISNLAPEGRGLRNFAELVVRLNDFKNKIHALVKIANRHEVVIRFFGLPACILGKFSCYSNDFCWDKRLNIEQDKNERLFLKKEECISPARNRVKTVKCQTCLYNEVCGGVFEEYLGKFGDEELEPFSYKD